MPRASQSITLQSLRLGDFSGGLNDTNVAPLIKDNQLQTATNVFVNLRGGIEKRYGYISNSAPLNWSSGQSLKARLLNYRTSSFATNDSIIYSNNGDLTTPTVTNFNAASTAYIGYSQGSATFTHNSATVTRSTGTAEYLTQIFPNDLISADSITWYTVQSVSDNSTVVLTANYTGSTTTTPFTVRQQLNTSYPTKGTMFNGVLCYGPLTNGGGSNTIGTWNGLSTRRVTSPPTGSGLGILCNHQNYLFGVDSTGSSNGSRLFWSALLDQTTWPASNFVDVSPNDGDFIRAIVSHNNLLYIFKDHSIYYLVGNGTFDPSNPTYSLNKIINPYNIGTTSGESVKILADSLVFLGQDGLYKVDGVTTPVNISEGSIRTTIRSLNNSYPGNGVEAAAITYDNRYWISVNDGLGAGTGNDLSIVIEPNGSFTRHSLGLNNMVLAYNTTSKNYAMIALNNSDGTISQFDGTATNDGSSAITSTATTKVFGFGDFSKTTHVEDVYVAYYNAANQAATLHVYDDSGEVGSGAAWTFPGGTTQFITVQRYEINRDTNGLYLTITDNTSNKSFRVMGIQIRYWKDMTGSGVVVTS